MLTFEATDCFSFTGQGTWHISRPIWSGSSLDDFIWGDSILNLLVTLGWCEHSSSSEVLEKWSTRATPLWAVGELFQIGYFQWTRRTCNSENSCTEKWKGDLQSFLSFSLLLHSTCHVQQLLFRLHLDMGSELFQNSIVLQLLLGSYLRMYLHKTLVQKQNNFWQMANQLQVQPREWLVDVFQPMVFSRRRKKESQGNPEMPIFN